MLTKLKNLFSKEEKTDQTAGTSEETPEKTSQNIQEEISKDLNIEEAGIVNNATENAGSNGNAAVEEKPEKSQHSIEEIKEEVIKVLKTCYDPEIPVDVWELGLIYEINVATNGDVLLVMTLTSPSCPVAGILPGEIEQKIKDHPMVNDCKVQLTYDPPWSQKNMSEVAKLELGFL
jgi:FeS assembly SUF system protein